MFDSKLKVEKVEMVKRIIRQNNYHQYEKAHMQCQELGLNVNLPALERFANKLELIDRAELARRQDELHKIDLGRQEQEMFRSLQKQRPSRVEQPHREQAVRSRQLPQSQPNPVASPAPVVQRNPHPVPTQTRAPVAPHHMTYEEVKQRETEITFELGELKIRENELLQELIRLTEYLDGSQVN